MQGNLLRAAGLPHVAEGVEVETHSLELAADGLYEALGPGLRAAAHVADLVTLASNADEKAFEGFYTDPENHPGGSRKITVDDGTVGVFRQAWIDGGGGEGEPASYTLPALVKGDRIIARPRRPKGCSCDAAHRR